MNTFLSTLFLYYLDRDMMADEEELLREEEGLDGENFLNGQDDIDGDILNGADGEPKSAEVRIRSTNRINICANIHLFLISGVGYHSSSRARNGRRSQ